MENTYPVEMQTPEEVPQESPDTTASEPEPEKTNSGYPKEIEDAILVCADYYEKEEAGFRYVMIGFWRKLENYFNGIQRIFWDYNASDWARIPDEGDEEIRTDDPSLYDKIINIYRAHGESLIAALSIKVPNVIFYPDDADISDDICTAKAYSKISELIQKHNQGILLFIKAIFILFNQGVCAAYIYNRADKEFGEYELPDYGEDVNVTTVNHNCPVCQGNMASDQLKNVDPSLLGDMEQQPQVCQNCQSEVTPQMEHTTETIPQIVGYTKYPKSRTAIDVFGPLYAHMPFYARKQSDMPYIRLRFEQHISMLQSHFENIRDLIAPNADNNTYDRYARVYSAQQIWPSQNLVTVTMQWLRPWSFQCLPDEEIRQKMLSTFPNGCYATIIGKIVAEARDEDLDKHWEITTQPTSNHLHADPMGKVLAPVQDMRNEAVDLGVDTFEHSIPETFADTDALDFDAYGTQRAKPGMKYPVKVPPGRSIGDMFYSDKPATLSEELEFFIKRIDTDGQFVAGSFPSIYGGPAQSGSKTASEYSESRSMALQRLNTTWTTLKYWWANILSKAVPIYVEQMIDDEKFVTKSPESATGFVNIWIRQQDLVGKIGLVEPEADEELPVHHSQFRQTLMELIGLNNEQINSALFRPDNTPIIAKALGSPDFNIPGKGDRDKQFYEFAELLQSGPNPDGSPTVLPELAVDDDQVHIQTCRAFLVSPSGLAIKAANPEGYANIFAHGKAHYFNMKQMESGDIFSPAGEPSPTNSSSVVD